MKKINSNEGTSRNHFFSRQILGAICVLQFIFTVILQSFAGISIPAPRNDTIPQTDVFKLKRSDIYVVIVEPDSVRIRLKNQDSIMMSRPNFDSLPAAVKKEISALNDGNFSNVQVQIESAYPGGSSAWLSYLNRTFSYPQEAQRNSIQGTVIVQFIVDEQGKVSDIEAVSGPTSGGLREEAIRVIRRSGRWEPAIWNGYRVKSYKRQPLIFRLTP